ncbi:MAG: conjugal transfer protein TraX [Defluviitaleaceae bacterium]|nr:conjugal transfer protein TraX [Defluviitaleaceae bacterium]
MSASVLKLIALITMMIDHSAIALDGYWTVSVTPGSARLYWAMRAVGRAAFIIYAYFIAEGCRKTHDMRKYLLRLGIFALVSEVPFDFLFQNMKYVNTWKHLTFLNFTDQNVFFTLFLGALAIYLWQLRPVKTKRLALGNAEIFGYSLANFPLAALNFLIALCPVALAQFLRTDYDWRGAGFIFLLYLLRKRPLQIAAVAAFSFYLYYGAGAYSWWLVAGGCAAGLLLAMYNGRRGFRAKWFFYAAYPLHLLILAAIFRAIVK